jgi:hypothetical protein
MELLLEEQHRVELLRGEQYVKGLKLPQGSSPSWSCSRERSR